MKCIIYLSRNLMITNEALNNFKSHVAVWVNTCENHNILFIVISSAFETFCRTCRSDNFGTTYENRKHNYLEKGKKHENCLF